MGLNKSIDWFDQLEKLEITLKNLKDNGLKFNIEKQSFGKTEIEYLGFWVTRNGIQPTNKKLDAIINMMPPKNQKQVQAFIGLVNYYMDMWSRRSHLLHPLTTLTSDNENFK